MMKHHMTKLLALLLALALLMAMGACKPTDQAAEAPDDEADREQIAVMVGDAYPITKGEIADAYEEMITAYSYYGMPAPAGEAEIEAMQDSVVEMLANEKIQMYHAELMGVALTDEQLAEIEAETSETMEGHMAGFRAKAEAEGAKDVEARAEEIFNQELSGSGMKMDMAGYREYLYNYYCTENLLNMLEEKVKSEVSIEEADEKAYFADLLAKQKETYAETPADYLNDRQSYEMYGGNPVLVTPAGYVRVKAITISPAEQLGEEYETLLTEMTELEAEYGKLALGAEAQSAKRMAEIVKSYNEKKSATDEQYEAYISPAREKADTAYAALQGGMSFDEALKEYGEDEMFITYPIFAKKGILMMKEGDLTWDERQVAEVLKLQKGAYSPVVQLDDMFYIFQLVGDEPVGETAYEDVKDEIHTLALGEKAQEYWTAKTEEWANDTSLVTYHEDVYRSVGKKGRGDKGPPQREAFRMGKDDMPQGALSFKNNAV